MDDSLAPVVLFAYKRLDTLQRTVEALKANYLASKSKLFIFSDGAKSNEDIPAVNSVRNYLHSVTGFDELHVIEAIQNRGLSNSIISGVTDIINKYNKIIVIEDDLLVSANFLDFMNQSMFYYEKYEDVFSVSGFMFDIKLPKNYQYDVFFTKRHCSWGWGMWKNRWNEIDWQLNDFESFLKSKYQQKEFNRIGSDLTSLLIKQMSNKINSWAVRCNYHQFKKQSYTVYPLLSKVVNIGFTEGATHTTQYINKYYATLDNTLKQDFCFSEAVFIDYTLLRRFTRKYSKLTRIFYFILNKFYETDFLRLGKQQK